MVVNGLTTVYCNTPSLHLNSKTLPKKKNSAFHLLISLVSSFLQSPQIKITFTNDATFILNSFNLVNLNGYLRRMGMVAYKLSKYYFLNCVTTTSSERSPFLCPVSNSWIVQHRTGTKRMKVGPCVFLQEKPSNK